jgi:hypothetical protein
MQKVLLARKNHVSEILDRVGIVSVEIPDDYDLEQPLRPPLAVVTPATPPPTNRDASALIAPNEMHSDLLHSDHPDIHQSQHLCVSHAERLPQRQ